MSIDLLKTLYHYAIQLPEQHPLTTEEVNNFQALTTSILNGVDLSSQVDVAALKNKINTSKKGEDVHAITRRFLQICTPQQLEFIQSPLYPWIGFPGVDDLNLKGFIINSYSQGLTPLFRAVRDHDKLIVQLLIDACKEDTELLKRCFSSYAPLPSTMTLEIMEMLLKACGENQELKERLFSPDAQNHTTFYLELSRGEKTELLQRALQDPQLKRILALSDAINQNTLMHLAVMREDSQPLELLLKTFAKDRAIEVFFNQNALRQTPFHLAFASKNKENLALLMEYCSYSTKIKLFGDQSYNLFYQAVIQENIELVEILARHFPLECKELLLEPILGSTPLEIAQETNNENLAQIIFNTIFAKNKEGIDLINFVLQTHDQGRINHLYERLLTPLAPHNLTVLQLHSDLTEITSLFKECPAKLKPQLFGPHSNGITLFHTAVRQASIPSIKLLLEYCPPELKNKFFEQDPQEGNTPFHLALMTGDVALVSYLKEHCKQDFINALNFMNKKHQSLFYLARINIPILDMMINLVPDKYFSQIVNIDVERHLVEILLRFPYYPEKLNLLINKFKDLSFTYLPSCSNDLPIMFYLAVNNREFIQNYAQSLGDLTLLTLAKQVCLFPVLTEAERHSILQKFKPAGYVHQVFSSIPQEDITAELLLAFPIFTAISKTENLNSIPEAERASIVIRLKNLFYEFNQRHDSFILLPQTHIFLWAFPDSILQEALERGFQHRLPFHNITLFFNDTQIKQKAIQCLIEKLETIQATAALQQIQLLKEIAVQIAVPEDHDLFFKIYQVISVHEAPTQQNPYSIFKWHQESIKSQQELLADYSEIADSEGIINLQALRNSVKTIRYKDLPPASGADLKEIIQTFQTRWNSLSVDHRAAVEKSVFDLMGTNLTTLLNDSKLINNSTIDSWLTKTGDPNEACEPVLYKLRYLVAHLKAQSDVIQDNLLSSQEELFLKWSLSINLCSGGLREGINVIYGSLREIPDYVEATEAIIGYSLQKCAESILSNEDFLKEVSGSENISQGTHYTLFLANRLYVLIGLKHAVGFDLNAGIVPEELLLADLKTLASTYFKYFTPKLLIEQLQKDLSERLNHGSTSALVDFCTSKNLTLSDLIEDRNGVYSFTKRGVCEILKTLDLLRTKRAFE